MREAVLLMLERGAAVNLQANNRPTALTMAAMHGRLEVMRDLFAAGGGLHQLIYHGEPPLIMALLGGQPEAAEMLLDFGADITVTGYYNALIMAARGGYARLATQILAKATEADGGEDLRQIINAQDSYGRTALIAACATGSETLVRVLLQHPEIDVDRQDEDYFTALLHAVSKGHAGIAEALLARGASVKPDARAVTSVLIEASRRGMSALVRLILDIMERGGGEADVDFRDNQGCTALTWACRSTNVPDRISVADMLLRAGANVDGLVALDADGWTPLMYATSYDSGAELSRLLLEHGADVNAQNSDGSTVLKFAIDNNNKEAVKALLNSGARVHADTAQRQLVEYIYELKRDMEAVIQVFPHALAASSASSDSRQRGLGS
jgi:serine/threonine-protein phosphatase 6 regulatory ankyrin repeat subunit B